MAFDLNSVVPEGWEAVDYRAPQDGENYLFGRREEQPDSAVWRGNNATYAEIILKRKRWRAESGHNYYYVTHELHAGITRDAGLVTDSTLYEIGNYFRTIEEAEDMAEKFRSLFKAEAMAEKFRAIFKGEDE